jgi:hypothetical protein
MGAAITTPPDMGEGRQRLQSASDCALVQGLAKWRTLGIRARALMLFARRPVLLHVVSRRILLRVPKRLLIALQLEALEQNVAGI